ncbi:hypothetical protein ACHAXR_002804 [Thalassiosira sp. AJA248-18]
MATHPHPMSTNSSLGTYDSLFDDDAGTLGGICFDLDVQQVVVPTESGRCNGSSWCKSSSSSCCSLCRLPAVSDADEDDSNIYGLGNDSFFQSRPRDAQAMVSLPRGSSVKRKHQSSSMCASDCMSSSCGPCEGVFQLPIKSISFPRSCIDSSPVTVDSKAVPNDCNDFLSTSFLPDDALCHIVKFLDVASLIRLRECNKKLHDAASINNAGWKDHCTSLWSNKANVCSSARSMLAESSEASHEESPPKFAAMEAYKISVTDAANRKEISFEEICFDASPAKEGIVWSFRFKESAGLDWTSWDPWWNGQDARKLVFLRDGTIRQVHPQGIESSTRSHNGTRLYDVFSERTVHRDGIDVPAPRIEMKWRFVNRPLDLPVRPEGAYVRITVGGRDVPTYVVRRSPNGNWGFILESCWGVYASFELAPQVQTTSIVGRGRRRLRRTRNGSRWVNVEDSDNDSGDDGELDRERMRNVRRRIDLFVEESAMTQDGYSQWREALLYNIGAVTLPEGNGDQSDEFDRVWQNAMMMR